MFFIHVFIHVFIKVKKTCFLCFFYLQINVFIIYGVEWAAGYSCSLFDKNRPTFDEDMHERRFLHVRSQ